MGFSDYCRGLGLGGLGYLNLHFLPVNVMEKHVDNEMETGAGYKSKNKEGTAYIYIHIYVHTYMRPSSSWMVKKTKTATCSRIM